MKINFQLPIMISCSSKLLVLFQIVVLCAAKQICDPSSCGQTTNISYPFRLKNDPANCGDPKYELACENNHTILTLFSGKYYVKLINYTDYTIRLVDPGIQQDDCSSIPRYFLYAKNFSDSYPLEEPYQKSQLKRLFDPVIYGLETFKHVIYMKCSNPVTDDPDYASTASCIKHDFFYAIAGDLRAHNIRDECHVEVVAATSFLSYDNSKSFNWDAHNEKYSYDEIHRMLVYGFDVSWMGSACQEACGNPDCALKEITGSLECLHDPCHTPFGDTLCYGTLSKLRMLVEAILYDIAKGFIRAIRVAEVSDLIISETRVVDQIGSIIGNYVLPLYIVARFMIGLLVLFAMLIHRYRTRHTSMFENIEDFLQGNSLMPIRYSYKDIKNMTKDFKDKLGEGGYGLVYKGKLRSGPLVAIKILGKGKSEANGQDFISEVQTIGRIHHGNIVRLIGFCVEGSKRALIYEFMSNGSLDKYISSKEDTISLTHNKMYEISLGVARGIGYLHQGCDMQILHFDIKPHNILLDENFIPKVSDFGLAKFYPIDNSIVTLTAARGTIGYMAPELFYKNIGGVSYKADVYSFGMLLMELASKRRNLNAHADHSSQIFFPFWIYSQLTEEKEIEMDEVFDDDEKKIVKKMIIVAIWCIQLNPSDRPSMYKVIEMLESDIDDIEMPPKPLMYPDEMLRGDLQVSYEKMESNAATSSSSFLEETTTKSS